MTPPSSPGLPVVRGPFVAPRDTSSSEGAPPRQLGRYQVLRKLATGGMAEVFLGRTESPLGVSKTVVLKRILPHLASSPEFLGMFLAEARLATQLDHPNVVQVFDWGEADGTCFLVMEYVDGAPLGQLARRACELRMPMPVALCARLIAAACEGLAYAHELVSPETGEPLHLVHRDVSPDNIMLTRTGAVKVLDFGIARSAGQSRLTRAGTIKGKLAYLAPERLRGGGGDVQGDVFALGLVLYELVCGQKPYEAQCELDAAKAILHAPFIPIEERRPDVPRALRRIIHKAIAKKREERYQDCRQLQAALEQFLFSIGQPVGAIDLARFFHALEAGASARTPALPPLRLEQARPVPGTAQPSGRPTRKVRCVSPSARPRPSTTRLPSVAPAVEPRTRQRAALSTSRLLSLGGVLLVLACVGLLAWS